MIVENPARALYDPALPTYVTTDASHYGLGGVLSQLHPDNTDRIVAFASRTHSPAESIPLLKVKHLHAFGQ